MKLTPPPRLKFKWTDLGRKRAILAVKRLKVGNANAEARIVRPRLVVVLDKVEGDAVALDASHAVALPDNGEAHVLRVEAERRGQAVDGGYQWSDGIKGCLHGRGFQGARLSRLTSHKISDRARGRVSLQVEYGSHRNRERRTASGSLHRLVRPLGWKVHRAVNASIPKLITRKLRNLFQ